MIYGYARVSSAGQQRYGNSLQDQSAQLRAAGAVQIYSDTFTGTKKHRPELDKLLSVLQPGDTLIVTKLDRIARSTKDGIDIIDQLVSSGVGLHVLNMGKFDATPTGKLMRTILFAFAEFERDMIVQRTQDGKAVARTNPDYREGRKPAQYDQAQFRLLLPAVSSGEMTVSDAAARLGVSRAKWYRLAAAENA